MRKYAIYFVVFILFIFLFIGGESQQKHRLIKDIWDTGHLVLFGLLSYGYFSHQANANHSIVYKVIFTFIACLVIGTTIEVIQLLVHRDFSRSDIINNIIGGYIGLLSLYLFNKQNTLKTKSITFVLILFCIAVGLRHMERHLFDEFHIRQDFPLLSGFESKFEMERWENSLSFIKRSTEFVKEGSHSLKVDFLPGRYPNIVLRHFKGDWSDFSTFSYSVYNPTDVTHRIKMKVSDQKHIKRGLRFNDRFNRSVSLKPGWNTITTPLNEIQQAPKHRSMDLHKIKSFSLFTDKLPQPLTLYIDNIHLL